MAQRLVVLGAGESGSGAAVLGKLKGYDVFVSDMACIKNPYKDLLNQHEIDWEEGTHSLPLITNADFVVKSPGISDTVPIMKLIKDEGIKVISEIEFASWFCNSKLICVTGSNGKTTTTLLIYEIFKNAGFNVGLAGNIGNSFALQLALKQYDYYVLEVSSFQLDDCYTFRPDIAIITNITPDHLDRYNYDFNLYVKSKLKIASNQTPNDILIVNHDDKVILGALDESPMKSKIIPFSLNELALENGACITNDEIRIKLQQKTFGMKINNLGIRGRHNVSNSMAAAISAMVMDIKSESIREALADFKGVEHRLERVAAVRGIEFVNDSKATNVNSTWYALECLHSPVVWIAGGTDKGNDYSELSGLVKNKVRALVCIGKDNSKLIAQFKNDVATIVEAESMDEAVKMAYFLSKTGDTVLLSPACASFDRFKNYEERGNLFKKMVRKL